MKLEPAARSVPISCLSARLLLAVLFTLLGCLAAGQGNVPPQINLSLSSDRVKSGAELQATLTISFAEGLHAYQNPPSEDYMIPVSVASVGEDFKVLRVEYPGGVEAVVGGDPNPVRVYEGTIKIPFVLKAPGRPGEYTTAVEVQYQQCDANNCFAPKKERLSAKVIVEAVQNPPIQASKLSPDPKRPNSAPPRTGKTGETQPRPDLAQVHEPNVGKALDAPESKDPGPGTQQAGAIPPSGSDEIQVPDVKETSSSAPPPPLEVSADDPLPPAESEGFLADSLQNAFQSGNYGIVILIALLTGIALAVTPCVYPMIPITVSFFSNQVAGNRLGKVFLGLMYMLGLAITYGAVGGISAALGGTIGALFQAPWFLFALGTLMAILALSMFDVYEIRIPQFLGRQIKGRSGAAGALIMGLLMGFAAAPCAGPVVTAFAVKVAEAKSVPVGLLLFTSIGVGLGLPFFLLGAFATGAKGLPKAGGWLKTLKALLGIVVFWVALNYFLQAFQVRAGEPLALAVQAAFLILSALYLVALDRSGSTQLIWGLKGTAILLCGVWAGMFLAERRHVLKEQELAKLGAATRVAWQKFTPESFKAAKGTGKPIVIDASADWCAVCKEIEEAVFDKPAGIAAMRDVVALRIDHSTGVDPAYIEMTTKMFNIKGLPHIQVLAPGGKLVALITGKSQLDSPDRLKEYLRRAGLTL